MQRVDRLDLLARVLRDRPGITVGALARDLGVSVRSVFRDIDHLRERGYPIDDFEQRAADISVDHPNVVDHYRAAHAIHVAQEHGDIGTEAQREAFVHYRALFEKLLATDLETDKDTPKEARA